MILPVIDTMSDLMHARTAESASVKAQFAVASAHADVPLAVNDLWSLESND
jgi:hypothetical protein